MGSGYAWLQSLAGERSLSDLQGHISVKRRSGRVPRAKHWGQAPYRELCHRMSDSEECLRFSDTLRSAEEMRTCHQARSGNLANELTLPWICRARLVVDFQGHPAAATFPHH